MKNKLIISGCSYSAYTGTSSPYADVLKKNGYSVYNMSWCGSSNESIINRIYECIKKNDVTDSLILCQLTYIHRIGWYHNFAKRWIDYQPKYIQTIPKYDVENDSVKVEVSMKETFMEGGDNPIPNDVSKEEFKILTKMYKTWLEYVYDEDEMFNYLLYKIDTLKAYVDTTGNKIEFIYWPDIQRENQLEEIKKRSFLNIEGEYSMLKWSTKNKLIDDTSHLNKNGHDTFSNFLDNKIKNEHNNLKKEFI
jgi:hypothetical protein